MYEKKKAFEGMVMELQFTEDSALVTETRSKSEDAIKCIASDYGLAVSYNKTKFIGFGPTLCHEKTAKCRMYRRGEVQHVKSLEITERLY